MGKEEEETKKEATKKIIHWDPLENWDDEKSYISLTMTIIKASVELFTENGTRVQ